MTKVAKDNTFRERQILRKRVKKLQGALMDEHVEFLQEAEGLGEEAMVVASSLIAMEEQVV